MNFIFSCFLLTPIVIPQESPDMGYKTIEISYLPDPLSANLDDQKEESPPKEKHETILHPSPLALFHPPAEVTPELSATDISTNFDTNHNNSMETPENAEIAQTAVVTIGSPHLDIKQTLPTTDPLSNCDINQSNSIQTPENTDIAQTPVDASSYLYPELESIPRTTDALPIFDIHQNNVIPPKLANEIAENSKIAQTGMIANNTPHQEIKPTPLYTPASNYFGITIEALYWQAIQDNMLASIKANGVSSGTISSLVWINQRFDFAPGFRLSAEAFFPYDQWSLLLGYTFLRTSTAQLSKNDEPEFYMILSGHMQSLSEQVKADWEMHFQSLELMLGREFPLSNYIGIKPQMGMKGAYPNQKWHVSYIHPTLGQNELIFLNQKISNSFWSIGPNLRIDWIWKLPKDWTLEIKPSWSIMYARIVSKVNYCDIANASGEINPDRVIRGTEKVSTLIPQMEIWLGAKWAYRFGNHRLFAITFGYDVQYWWNEANILAFVQLPQGNLMLHGATGGFHFSY